MSDEQQEAFRQGFVRGCNFVAAVLGVGAVLLTALAILVFWVSK